MAVDFRGLKSACASCHLDVHQAELGVACETCHSTTSFRLLAYRHARYPEFFTGQHAPLACDKCHVSQAATRPLRTAANVLPVKFKTASTACVSCHTDVHLGQEGARCETCHSVNTAKFAASGFSHGKTGFPLTGRHETVACASCHKVEAGTFPAGVGKAMRLKGTATTCSGCHADVHLGQLGGDCQSCHATLSFKTADYRHRNRALSSFFVGRHVTACESCHKPTTGPFPAGRGTAIRFQIDTRCVACHVDIHRGALGANCAGCHRP
jgi:hypothetical protein